MGVASVPSWLSSPFKNRKNNNKQSSSSASSVVSSSASPVDTNVDGDDDRNEEEEEPEDELEAETRRILGLAVATSPPASSGCWPMQDQQRQRQLHQQLLSQDELLKLYILKLEEEANYFKATSPVDDEFCACPKCQVSTSTKLNAVNGYNTVLHRMEQYSSRNEQDFIGLAGYSTCRVRVP